MSYMVHIVHHGVNSTDKKIHKNFRYFQRIPLSYLYFQEVQYGMDYQGQKTDWSFFLPITKHRNTKPSL